MSTIVSKFGGSSVADADGFRRVRDILALRHDPQYIVLSAPGKRHTQDQKITDLLCQAYDRDAAALAEVQDRFAQIITLLELKTDLTALQSALGEDVAISRDHAASRGEFLCAKLFAEFTGLPFADAANLIYFDAHGRIAFDKTRSAIRQMARRFPRAVIPGFYGRMPDGSLKTLSRGGSDITGALVAAALNADCYENWTDVDGLMSADPLLCPDAVTYPAVSYRQMLQIAEAGAQVLHPCCLSPVRDACIPTILRNTYAPERPGTYISNSVHDTVPCVCTRTGYRLVALNHFPSETQALLCELCQNRYLTRDGQDALLLSNKGSGESVSLISVFGLVPELQEDASRLLRPLATLTGSDCFCAVVPSRRQDRAVRFLHSLLRLDAR